MKEKLRNVQARLVAITEEVDKLLSGDATDKTAKIDALEGEYNDLVKTRDQITAQIKRQEDLANVPESERFRSAFNLNANEERDVGRFSFLRFFDSVERNRPLSGIEAEMAQLARDEAQRAGAMLEGLGIPTMILANLANRGRGIRNDMTATGTTSTAGDQGGTSIQTTLRGLVSPLYSRTVLAGLGTSFLTGLVGNVSIPTFGDTTEQTEKGENSDADEATSATGSVTMSPKRLPVVIDLSQQLLMQSSVDVEAWANNHLLRKVGIRIDRMAIHGAGSSNQPTGILATSGIGSVVGGTNGAAPTWANIVALETAIAASDADVGSLNYLTNPKVRGKLKTTEKFSGTNGMAIWENGNTLNGYGVGVSNVVSSTLTKGSSSVASAIIFGNFEDLIIGGWGGLDVQRVTDRASAIAGKTSIVVTAFYDAVVQRATSFAAMKDALTA